MNISEMEKLIADLDKLKIGMDDLFQFSCNRCGKCCYWRDDIMVSPSDVFRASKVLEMQPLVFVSKYCEVFLGGQSRIPLVRVKSDAKDGHCVLLKNKQCSVHQGKPVVCAIYPLGRYIDVTDPKDDLKVGYLNQGHNCGCSESHTVREWILSFGLEKEDEIFKQWSVYQSRFGKMFQDLERMLTDEEFSNFIVVFVGLVYGLYDTSKEFLPQLINNCEKASGMVLSKIVRNRGPFYER